MIKACFFNMSRLSRWSGIFLALVVAMAVFAPWIAPYSFESQDAGEILSSPSDKHWMGTDRLGRDLFSRIVYGSRNSLFVGVFATLLAVLFGTVYGAVSGYAGGKTDHWMMRTVDVLFALPDLLMIILITVAMGRGMPGIFLALMLVSWATVARLVRGEVLRLKEFAFVEAARALGAGHARILTHEIFPNLFGVLMVTLSFRIPAAILAESTLSFIGLGIAPPASSWGTLANDGWTAVKFYPHLIVYPSLMIFATILACNFLGEGLRDALDQKSFEK